MTLPSQSAVAAKPFLQELHLVGKNQSIRQHEVFGSIRHVRNREQVHPGFFRGARAFRVVTRFAGGHDVFPAVSSAPRKG